MSVGTRLRQLRRDRGLSVEELSARTRIAARILRSIEQDDFDAVPSGIFLRGYLRACAREVGLDAETLVEQYRTEHEPAPPAPEPAASERAPATPVLARLGIAPRLVHAPAALGGAPRHASAPETRLQMTRPVSAPAPSPNGASPRPVLRLPAAASAWKWEVRPVALGLGTTLVIVLALAWASNRSRVTPSVHQPVAATASTSVAAQPVGTSGTMTQTAGAAVDGSPSGHAAATDAAMRLQLTATRRVWVTAHADHKRVVYRLLNADEQVSLTGTEQIKVRVGDAGALLYSLNGSEPRPAGSPGEVRNVAFSRAQPVY